MSRISVVIPALNTAAGIARAIESAAGDPVAEIIVSDGGSADETVSIAEAAGARVLTGSKGRGVQLRQGAEAASSDWLLFLHADTALSPSWRAEVGNFIAMPGNRGRAAAFRFRLDSKTPQARRIERLVAWRCRRLGLPYGDQGLLISRRLYEECGGYDAVPLMEDVALVRRIGRRRLHMFDAAATTSAARYERDGWWRRPARNLICLGLYMIDVPPRFIARLYG